MKKSLYIAFTVVFFLVCLIPIVGLAVKGPSPAAANEPPVVKPKLKAYDGSWNMSYLTGWRDYVGKGFYLRLPCITAWDTLCAGLFHTSANDDVLIGPDNWLFFGAAANDISGNGQMTDREIFCCARSLYLMQEYAEGQGADFVFTVPCGKYTLYPAHAPRYVTVAEGSNRARLMTAMEEQGVRYADLYAAFSAVDEELYWQWDSHWNARGAALAADTILGALGIENGYFSGDFTAAQTHSGDLYAMLYPTGTALETDYTPEEPFTFSYTSNFHDSDDITITTEREGAEGTLLLFRDSSGRNLYPYLADRFGAAHISRLNNYRLDYIAEQGADTVIVELAERTLDYLLRFPAVYPAPERDAALLDGLQEVESELTADASGTTMADFMKLTGTLPETAADACVYLLAGDALYEAIPNEGSFTAWLPMDTDAGGIRVFAG